MTTRNDDHGVGVLRRTQIFLDGLADQAKRHRLDTELVIVEWNPPPDRPPLSEVLVWPAAGEFFTARIVTVPESAHRRLEHSDRLPLFQMIAKNVGIRRATGEFILATNVDLLFSDELMSFLARRTLRRDRLYRVDRYDAGADVPYPAPVAEQLAWCDANLLRICRRQGTYDLVNNRYYRIYEDIRLPLWTAPWLRLLRNGVEFAKLVWAVSRGGVRALARRVRTYGPEFLAIASLPARALWAHGLPRRALGPRELIRRVQALMPSARAALAERRRLRAHDPGLTDRLSLRELLANAREDLSFSWRDLQILFADERARMRLHTNACGDFTMLAREGWEATGAYPELQVFSMHIDSLFMYHAHYGGITEEFLPYRVYHIEHSHGFKPDVASVKELASRLDEVAIPQISNAEFLSWVIEMRKTAKPRFENPRPGGSPSSSFRTRPSSRVRATRPTRKWRPYSKTCRSSRFATTGTDGRATSATRRSRSGRKEYFDEVEARKYLVEPHIPGFADFPALAGKTVLEIGCGIGTDTINFARNGAARHRRGALG